MNITHSIILGIVEGITEFLPVSSTFHLIWSSRFLNLVQSDFIKLFEVFIQGGAILAVVFLYWKEIVNNRILVAKLIVSFIPTALVGLLLYKVIKGLFFESIVSTTVVFVAIGIVFIIVEYFIKNGSLKLNKSIAKLSYRDAFIIGILQSLAVVPGVSRAGAVMVGMMFFGFKRDESAKYSFMLSVPTILAASGYDLFKMREVAFASSSQFNLLLIGFVVSAISAFIGVKWLISYLQHNSLALFGWYRVVVGIILLITFIW